MKRYVIAIDLGGTDIKAAVVKDGNKLSGKISVPTGNYGARDALIGGLAKIVGQLTADAGLNKRDLLGIGIGAPGLIDSKKGIIHELVNIKDFREVPLKRLIERKTGIRTFLDNDVNVMTLGELHYGAGRGAKNIVCMTLGTGVGGGIVINGKLYRGSCMAAGEIGHMPINERGPHCGCGGFGCLEKYVGNKQIVKLAIRKIRMGERTIIKELVDGNYRRLTPRIISVAAKNGDGLAIAIWEEIGSHIGVALAGVINLLNPDRIIIGGGVAQAGRFLFDPIRAAVKRRAMSVPGSCVKIVKAGLGQDAGLIGAAVLVRLGI